MTTVYPYLIFEGNCEEALNFYKECFDGVVPYISRYKDYKDNNLPHITEEMDNKIMHTRLEFDNVVLMLADNDLPNVSYADDNVRKGVSLNLNYIDAEKMATQFNKLKVGGTVTFELQDAFWGDKFGMLTDKYGFIWMMNCPLNKSGNE